LRSRTGCCSCRIGLGFWSCVCRERIRLLTACNIYCWLCLAIRIAHRY
jgi:hypothetical protein